MVSRWLTGFAVEPSSEAVTLKPQAMPQAMAATQHTAVPRHDAVADDDFRSQTKGEHYRQNIQWVTSVPAHGGYNQHVLRYIRVDL